MHRSPRSVSSSQSPTDVHDRRLEREREYEHEREHAFERERVEHGRRALPESHSPPPPSSARGVGGGQARAPRQGPPTALPSIHHLHPDLPPPHAHRHAVPAQQYSPSEFLPGASYGPSSAFFAGSQRSPALATTTTTYPPPPAYEERKMSFDRPPGVRSLAQPPSAMYSEQHISPPEGDSDQEQNDSERGPPKKKRRRQALSCTECKRRKIKCDRTHPCGPCSRRSEPDKCQWHVIEPVDKYVTRSEWDDLYARYRLLEERCIRLEKLVVQMHPEITENSPYEIVTGNSATIHSPTAPRPTAISTRAYALAGPGTSGAGASSSAVNQRVTPSTPLSALPGPGPSPRSGPGAGVPALPVGSNTGAESSLSARSGSAPPPMLATPHSAGPSHPPPHPDRRTSASALHASFPAVSERTVPSYQVTSSETAPLARVRPLTAPSPRSYSYPPPPPLSEEIPGYLPSRSHGSSLRGRPSAAPEPTSVSSSRIHTARTSARPYPSPLSSAGGGRQIYSDDAAAELEMDMRYARHFEREHRHGRDISYERPVPAPQRRSPESKNGEAQTFEAGDALRQRWSASPALDSRSPFLSREPLPPAPGPAPFTTRSLLTHANPVYAHSDDSTPSSSRIGSPETPPRKRARHGSLYLNIPSAPGTPPPVLVH
ncbi:uncharacterized protein FOMMEDRAFT_15938 [Fomitiporia mediterranea MF3/22]|uniref:uncharacterized protein n=1 Tax=Fomitiporia mediterranea (strain MF3/22) TaxID=694068 RepID=UPI0004407389|nr:uncharacterized protein FOMMEDRAFT_15938 [Fomitiporia mediterranea MF3/22]EJD07211.1 hypothetical protein FOMMEDRAFT_15938 [Fomitiporia mediterranea MF3/22]